jgi:antitoxin (DNA-binding transcriptional repressor) of toxin-antitoxin stability system
MTQAVSKSQFKPHSLEYFRKIEQTGEELVITDHGRPVLKVVRYVSDPEESFRGLRNTVLQYDAPLEPLAVEYWEALK